MKGFRELKGSRGRIRLLRCYESSLSRGSFDTVVVLDTFT